MTAFAHDARRAPADKPPQHAPPIVTAVLRTTGAPLDAATRASHERRFGHDFGSVRVHSDALAAEAAAAVNARAFTVGRDVVFGRGEYAPGTDGGRRALAHELAHVAQQRGSAVPEAIPIGAPDAREEHAADAAATGGAFATAAPGPAVLRRQSLPDPPSSTGQLNLTLGEDGHVDFTVSGPEMPVIGNPTIGLRRNPNGTFSLLFGNSEHIVTPDEVPGMLRGAVGAGGTVRPPAGFRLPTCAQLRRADGTGFLSFEAYLLLPVSQPPLPLLRREFFRALVSVCSSTPAAPATTPPATTTPAATPPASLPQVRLPSPGTLTLGNAGLFPPRGRASLGSIRSATIASFDTASAALPAGAAAELDHLVSLLNIYREVLVHVDGHTDTRDTAEHNVTLSQHRAETVRDALVARGLIDPSRIHIRAAGESEPLVPVEQTDEQRAADRRVEVWYIVPPLPPAPGLGGSTR